MARVLSPAQLVLVCAMGSIVTAGCGSGGGGGGLFGSLFSGGADALDAFTSSTGGSGSGSGGTGFGDGGFSSGNEVGAPGSGGGSGGGSALTVATVHHPEPASVALFGGGLASMACLRRRRMRRGERRTSR